MQQRRAVSGAGLEVARSEFRHAMFASASQRLKALLNSTPQNADAALLLARTEFRQGKPAEALQVVTQYVRQSAARITRAEAALLKGVAFARLGDPKSAAAQFGQCRKLLRDDDALSAELTYEIAAAEWIERHLDRAARTLAELPAEVPKDLSIQAQIVKGAIASARENLPEQGAILLDALQHARSEADLNTYLYGMLVTQVAALAVELPSLELRDASITHVSRVKWTGDVGDLHFHAMRAIAWRHALDGDEFNAFRRLKEALSVTTSAAWRVAALADRAYLASALGEQRWAAQELRDAHDLAGTIDWNAVQGEEKLALPVLAEMFAQRDPSVAINYVATFKAVGHNYPRILSSHRDRRIEALEAYSLGKVQLALGQKSEAERLLLQSWAIYDRLGIQWRAARAALALAQIEERETWRRRADEALRAYPRSWLQRERPNVTGTLASTAPAGAGRLTAAQRAVFDLLIAGRGTTEIANDLGRSTFTVRNHIKAIFKAFGVSSRPALIVKAAQQE